MRQYKSSQSGFTLIETFFVIFIAGVVMTAATKMFLNYLQRSRILTTQSRMQDIDTAIIQYLSVNGVLPCPANLTLAPGTAKYGRSITDGLAATADCYNNAPANGVFQATGIKTGLFVTSPTPNISGFVAIGAVPVLSLKLPATDIADAWGDTFVYAVTDTLTKSTPANEYDPTQGSITVKDINNQFVAPAGGAPTASYPPAQYVIVSYGADRAGAYIATGKKSGIGCPLGAKETPNCTAITAGGYTRFVKSQLNSNQAGANMYDDYVVFHALIGSTGTVNSGLIAPFALAGGACPAGWTGPLGLPNADTSGTRPCTTCPACTPQVICCQSP